MAVIPEEYLALRRTLEFTSVNLGFNGVEFLPADEVESGQVGYAVAPNGESLCDGSAGAWDESWLVIGSETLCGDPLILDTLDPNLRVLHALQGQGRWEPSAIAPSLSGFFKGIQELNRLALGREDPVSLEANPIGDSEKSAFLEKIGQINGADGEMMQFWELMLENEA